MERERTGRGKDRDWRELGGKRSGGGRGGRKLGRGERPAGEPGGRGLGKVKDGVGPRTGIREDKGKDGEEENWGEDRDGRGLERERTIMENRKGQDG